MVRVTLRARSSNGRSPGSPNGRSSDGRSDGARSNGGRGADGGRSSAPPSPRARQRDTPGVVQGNDTTQERGGAVIKPGRGQRVRSRDRAKARDQLKAASLQLLSRQAAAGASGHGGGGRQGGGVLAPQSSRETPGRCRNKSLPLKITSPALGTGKRWGCPQRLEQEEAPPLQALTRERLARGGGGLGEGGVMRITPGGGGAMRFTPGWGGIMTLTPEVRLVGGGGVKGVRRGARRVAASARRSTWNRSLSRNAKWECGVRGATMWV